MKVSNECGGDSLHIADIHVYDTVKVSTTSTNADYCLHETVVTNLAVSISGGNGVATYQWYKNGVAISGATTNSYTPLTTVAGSFDYSVKVDNGCDNDSVHVANVRVYEAFALTNNSADTNYCLNSTADALSVSVTEGSTNPATYQWYKNGTAISEKLNTPLTISCTTCWRFSPI